jgi:hypothetical protein
MVGREPDVAPLPTDPTPPDIAEQHAKPPDPPAPKAKTRRKRATPDQPSLPMPGADPPADAKPPPIKHDLASDVLAAFNAAVADLRIWAGRLPGDGVTMTAGRRKEIVDRLNGIDGDADLKLALCRQVFAVQAHQIRSHGSDTGTEGFKRDWKSMRTSTLFAEKNFTRWLDRWSEDGDHDLWFQPKAAAQGRDRGAQNYGNGDSLAGSWVQEDADLKARNDAQAKEREYWAIHTPPTDDHDDPNAVSF